MNHRLCYIVYVSFFDVLPKICPADDRVHSVFLTQNNFILDKRPIVNPNDGFLSQLITYEGILNAIKNRYSFGRDFESGGGAAEQMNDSDIDLHNEIRVKKLVQFIQEREKAEIRRSKSNSRSSKRFIYYVMMTSFGNKVT